MANVFLFDDPRVLRTDPEPCVLAVLVSPQPPQVVHQLRHVAAVFVAPRVSDVLSHGSGRAPDKARRPDQALGLFVALLLRRRLHVAQLRVALQLAACVVGRLVDGHVLRHRQLVVAVVFCVSSVAGVLRVFGVVCVCAFVIVRACCRRADFRYARVGLLGLRLQTCRGLRFCCLFCVGF